MVPVRSICGLSAGDYNFLQRGDQRFGRIKQCVDIDIRLAFKIAHVKPENESEIYDQSNDEHGDLNVGNNPEGFKSGFVEKPVKRFGGNKPPLNTVGKNEVQKHIADKKHKVKYQMFSFDVTDFMSDDGIDFIGLKDPQQIRGYQYVAKPFDQPHDAGGNHFTAENRPIKNIRISQPRLPA